MHDNFSEGETGTDKVSCTSVGRRELNSPHPALTRSQTLATGFTFQCVSHSCYPACRYKKYPRTKEKRALTLRKACDLWMSSIYIAVLNMILLLCSQCERCVSSCHTIAGFWLIVRISLDQNARYSGILTWRSACKLSELGDKVFRINWDYYFFNVRRCRFF